MRVDRRAQVDQAGLDQPVRMTARAVSRPIVPGGAWSNSRSFSSGACGAWSVATASIVPAARASAARPDARRAEGRVDLQVRVVVDTRSSSMKREVVRRDVGASAANPGPLARRAPARPTAGRHVRDVQPAPGQPGQGHVPGDDDLLGLGRYAGQPQQRRVVPPRASATPRTARRPGRAGRSPRRTATRTRGPGA